MASPSSKYCHIYMSNISSLSSIIDDIATTIINPSTLDAFISSSTTLLSSSPSLSLLEDGIDSPSSPLQDHDVIVNLGNITDSHDTYNFFHDHIFTFEKANLFFNLAILAIILIITLLVSIGMYFMIISCITLFDDKQDERADMDLRLRYPKNFTGYYNGNPNNHSQFNIPSSYHPSSFSHDHHPPKYPTMAMSEKGFREEPLRPPPPSSI